MLLGEKLFWNVRAEGFSTQFSLGRTLQTRTSERRKRVGAAAEKGQRRKSALAQCTSRNYRFTVPWALSPLRA